MSSLERIKTNVDKETGDKIREMELAGVKVDEDFKRYYPYNELASKVIGFTGGDNQGIIGLEVRYEDYLKGSNGRILTTTDARGIELEGVAEDRVEPVAGKTLQISMDYNIQMYAQQMAEKVMEEKQADKVAILLMNPQNGEILAMVNVPEFDLNEPFTLNQDQEISEKSKEALNRCGEMDASMIHMSRVPLLKLLQRQPVWKKGWYLFQIHFPVQATGSWKTGKSGVTK